MIPLISFWGATTPAGFKGYFETAAPRTRDADMYLIKSGPGCGKSTLMKRLARAAEQRGEPVEKSTVPATQTVWTA